MAVNKEIVILEAELNDLRKKVRALKESIQITSLIIDKVEQKSLNLKERFQEVANV
jgi:hypothetical protein